MDRLHGQEGRQDGRKEGRKEGWTDGRKEGRTEGRAEGWGLRKARELHEGPHHMTKNIWDRRRTTFHICPVNMHRVETHPK